MNDLICKAENDLGDACECIKCLIKKGRSNEIEYCQYCNLIIEYCQEYGCGQLQVVANSDMNQVIDSNIPLINRNDKIVHNTNLCKGKFYKILRHIKYNKFESPAEIAHNIMLDRL